MSFSALRKSQSDIWNTTIISTILPKVFSQHSNWRFATFDEDAKHSIDVVSEQGLRVSLRVRFQPEHYDDITFRCNSVGVEELRKLDCDYIVYLVSHSTRKLCALYVVDVKRLNIDKLLRLPVIPVGDGDGLKAVKASSIKEAIVFSKVNLQVIKSIKRAEDRKLLDIYRKMKV